MNKKLVSQKHPLIAKRGENFFAQREELDKQLEELNGKIARLKKEREEVDLQLEKYMVPGEPVRTRDGRVVELSIVPVEAIVATDSWFAEHRNKTIRKGYSYPRYKVSLA